MLAGWLSSLTEVRKSCPCSAVSYAAPQLVQDTAQVGSSYAVQAIALMTLKQSDDPKFPLYGELPSPTMARGDGGFSSGGATLPPSFLPHHGTPFLPPSPALYSSPGGSHGMFPMLPPSMNGSTAPALAADGFSGGSSVALLLSEDQAALLLGDGSRVVVEVEQVGQGWRCAALNCGCCIDAACWPCACVVGHHGLCCTTTTPHHTHTPTNTHLSAWVPARSPCLASDDGLPHAAGHGGWPARALRPAAAVGVPRGGGVRAVAAGPAAGSRRSILPVQRHDLLCPHPWFCGTAPWGHGLLANGRHDAAAADGAATAAHDGGGGGAAPARGAAAAQRLERRHSLSPRHPSIRLSARSISWGSDRHFQAQPCVPHPT